jgi:hypothetical protein
MQKARHGCLGGIGAHAVEGWRVEGRVEVIAGQERRDDVWCCLALRLDCYVIVPRQRKTEICQDEKILLRTKCWRQRDGPASWSDRRHDKKLEDGLGKGG